MGIQKRMRLWAPMAVCASAAVAMISPGLASAACTSTTGSGSTLQTAIQQEVWTVTANNASFLSKRGCTGVAPKIDYNKPAGTGSGAGLHEFGIPSGALNKLLSANGVKLDGFIDTDDPPSAAQLAESSKAGQAPLLTVATVSAPIALIMHPPSACKVSTNKFVITNIGLDEQWANKPTWTKYLSSLNIPSSGTCTATVIHEVRSDESGTSFAFKQYLSHIQTEPWSTFVKDNAEWPTETEAKTTHEELNGSKTLNKGSGGEALAVFNTEGSEGYVNLADAAKTGFKAWTKSNTKGFWGELQNNGTKITGVTAAEPVAAVNASGKTPGNCPTNALAFGTVPAGKPPVWEVQLGGPNVAAGKYSLCTLTYDDFWASYSTTVLNTEYGGATAATEVGNTMKAYCAFMVSEEGQEDTEIKINFYSRVPTAVQEKGKELCEAIVA